MIRSIRDIHIMHPIKTIVILALCLFTGCERRSDDIVTGQTNSNSTTVAQSATEVKPLHKQESNITAVQTASNSAVQLSLAFVPADCKSGQSVQCIAKFKIGDSWHIYAMKGGAGPSQPTRLRLELPSWIKQEGEWLSPEAQMNLSNFGPEMIHTGEISITTNLKIGSDAPAGLHHIPCSVSLQACNANRCLPPETFSVSLPISVVSE